MLMKFLLLAICGIVAIAFTFFRNFTRRPTGIHDLPLELLSEIASHLDFVDMISLRQSTRKLREATEARVVWHSLAQRYAARHFNIPRPESGTIDTLSTNDLREWIWPRLAIDQIWRRKTVIPMKRRLDVHEDTVDFNIIRGGRWLLAVRKAGHVDFYDLNSKEPVPQPLLEPSAPNVEEAGPTKLVVDIDREAPVLDFTFAVSATGSIRFKRPSFGWLHIRQAWLTGTGPSTTLSAHKLVSIPHIRRNAVTCTIALSGGLAARSIAEGRNTWIEVFKWKECTSTELMVVVLRVHKTLRTGEMYFIGEDRILCVAKRGIFIHRIPLLSRLLVDWDPEVGYQDDKDIAEPVWSYDERYFALDNDPSLYFDGSTGYRLVVQDGRDVVGIYIPLSPDGQPCVQFRIQSYFLISVATGLYKGCAMYKESPAVRFGYEWGDNANASFVNFQSGEYSRLAELFFDEETGRCLLRETLTEIWVYDFMFC